jgi:flagellar basal body-associated protein FliL
MKNKKIYIIIIILVLIVISGGLFVLFNNKNAQKFEITGILELHDEKGY